MFCSIYLYQSDLYQKLLISYVVFSFWDPAKKAALVSNQKRAQRECSSCKLCFCYRLKTRLTISTTLPFWFIERLFALSFKLISRTVFP